MTHLLAELFGLIVILAALPGTVELLVLTVGGMLKPRALARCDGGKLIGLKRVAVIIPAHNEAPTIARCVGALRACAPPDGGVSVTVVVVADNCTDATAEIARAAGARVIVRVDTVRRGKGFALQDAFSTMMEEGCDAVVVVDADAVVEPNFVFEVVRLLALGADGVQTRNLVLNSRESMRTRLMNIALMAFNVLRPRGRNRWGLSAGIQGNGFALSRATLESVPYTAHSVVEDLEYHLELVRAGRRIVFAGRTSVCSDMPVGAGGANTQRARWEGGRLRMLMQHGPRLIGQAAAGNCAVIEPLLDLALPPLAYHVLILILALLIPFGPTRVCAAFAMGVVAVHVGAAIVVGGGGASDFLWLLAVPFYIGWKIVIAPLIISTARQDAPWVRTQRQIDPEGLAADR